jgi:hypothetical protein
MLQILTKKLDLLQKEQVLVRQREREREIGFVYSIRRHRQGFYPKKKQQREFSIVDNLFIQLFIRGTSN